MWFSGNCRGGVVLWGCFAGYARKTPTQILSVAVTPMSQEYIIAPTLNGYMT